MRDSRITGKERLEHIIQAINDIETFTKDETRESYLNDVVLINATLFHFAISFRNFILHEFHAIEYRIVWEAIKKDLPALKKITEEILINEYLQQE